MQPIQNNNGQFFRFVPKTRRFWTPEPTCVVPNYPIRNLPAEPCNRNGIAALEGLFNTNVDSFFSNAAALCLDPVLVSPNCADPLYRRSARVSIGAVFQVQLTRIREWEQGIADLKHAGYVAVGLPLVEGAIMLDELVAEDLEKLALELGNECHGITAESDTLLDRRVTIPMMGGVDSLNATAAATAAFYAAR